MPDTFFRAAAVTPQTVNEDDRTVQVVWSTGAAVQRADFDGPFSEVLSLDPKHVNLERLIGASVLDAHQQGQVRNVLGVVLDAKVDGNLGIGTVKFSARPDVQPIWEDVKAGILRHISVGYSVERWADTSDPATGGRVRTAIAWTPIELSFVPTPADPGATVRSNTMPDGNTFKPCEGCKTPNGCQKLGGCVTEAEANQGTDDQGDGGSGGGDSGTRSAPPVSTRAEINQQIRSIARTAGLPTSFADSLIDRNATVDQARASVFAEMERRSGGDIRTEQPRVEWLGSHDDPSIRAARMGEAMYARLNPQHQLSQEARQYAYATPAEMARELLTLRGISITGMSPAAIITRALHSTSDFSVIVGDTINRTLRQAYQAAPSGLKRIGRQTTASDFRTKTAVMLGEAPVLERLDETGEIKSGTMAEAKESYKVETFAKKIGISRQVLVNDDLGAFADLARRFGQAAVETEARLLVSLVEANSGNGPSMDDGNPLFHASHANKAGTGTAIADASLTEARLAIRTQKGLSGAVISATPKFLIVPPSLETLAEKWLASINPAMADDVNPHAGKLSLVVEPRLTSATRWYVAADPAEIDGLEFAYLAGENGPQVESKSGWDVDGVEVRVMLDFGAGFVDWRSWFMNPGA
ncbi:prohead protease/major capsid protein fusion protein [Caenispirillum bisanense]|uniref:prohead protease/major capsid protein fusion protein n=1 Tax=Caenispirillum bisanense TaxID=414052 RepID=UPI0031DD4AC5